MTHLLLHGGLKGRIRSDLVKPLRVDGTRCTCEGKSHARAGIVLVKDVDLGLELRVAVNKARSVASKFAFSITYGTFPPAVVES